MATRLDAAYMCGEFFGSFLILLPLSICLHFIVLNRWNDWNVWNGAKRWNGWNERLPMEVI